MRVDKKGNELFIELGSECLIDVVEEDLAKLKAKTTKNMKSIVIIASEVKEMDTAYLQLLLSMIKTADIKGADIAFDGMSDSLIETFKLYNVFEFIDGDKND